MALSAAAQKEKMKEMNKKMNKTKEKENEEKISRHAVRALGGIMGCYVIFHSL